MGYYWGTRQDTNWDTSGIHHCHPCMGSSTFFLVSGPVLIIGTMLPGIYLRLEDFQESCQFRLEIFLESLQLKHDRCLESHQVGFDGRVLKGSVIKYHILHRNFASQKVTLEDRPFSLLT